MLTQLHKNKIKKEEKFPKSKHNTHEYCITSHHKQKQTQKTKGGEVRGEVQGEDDYKVVDTGNTLG